MMVGECWNNLLFSRKKIADRGTFLISTTNLEAIVFVTLPAIIQARFLLLFISIQLLPSLANPVSQSSFSTS